MLLTWFSLSLSVVSQIAKRFVWRSRPWMVARAKLVMRTKTSSFPSRAVTCSVCYVVIFYVVAWNEMFAGLTFQWWMCFILPISVLLSSFSRVQLGVHYPSDCLFGSIQVRSFLLSFLSLSFFFFKSSSSLLIADRPCLIKGCCDQLRFDHLLEVWALYLLVQPQPRRGARQGRQRGLLLRRSGGRIADHVWQLLGQNQHHPFCALDHFELLHRRALHRQAL